MPLVMSVVTAAFAKDTPINAVVVFDGTQGAVYVQITGLTLNGKTEVRVCDRFPKIDKNIYNALPHLSLREATSLVREPDGVLRLTVNERQVCAVPDGLKIDKNTEVTPAQASEQAVLQGTLVSASAPDLGIPAFKPTVQLVFVKASDLELAEFLRAQRANTTKDWQAFIGRYRSSSHSKEAQTAAAALYEASAVAAFTRYQQSSRTDKPDLAALREANIEAQSAVAVSPANGSAIKLMDAVERELDKLIELDLERLQAFQKALKDHSSGYSQLAAAGADVQQLLAVRSSYEPLLRLKHEIETQSVKIETAISKAEALAASKLYDDALNSLAPYVSFTPEIPRMQAVVQAAYKHHFDRGKRLAAEQDWTASIIEFRKASAINPDSREAAAALENAETQLSIQHDQQQANVAVLESNEYAHNAQYIDAYNVLADLPDKQRDLVSPQMSALKNRYVPAATRRAQKLQELHIPIKTRSDEGSVLEAYVLLDRASSLSNDPSITVKRDFLSSKISDYYFAQASRYFEEPAGAGVGLGWLYLQAAQRYGITNLNRIKDDMARNEAHYNRLGRFSCGLVFRDETSTSTNRGFADQLADAVANGLENSGISFEIVRVTSQGGETSQPNFTLVGDVLEHRVTKNTSLESQESKYRVGTYEVKNSAWLQAKENLDTAEKNLQAARNVLADAQSQHRKSDIPTANGLVQAAQTRVDLLQQKVQRTDVSRLETSIASYHYAKKTIDLSASIDFSFRIRDRFGNTVSEPFEVHKSNQKSLVILQDVKPEDTEGITNQGTEPDEGQFLADLELAGRDAIVKAVREKASMLPAAVLQDARKRAQQADLDAAAEDYIMFLNSAPGSTSAEREEASKFLRDKFNLTMGVESNLGRTAQQEAAKQ